MLYREKQHVLPLQRSFLYGQKQKSEYESCKENSVTKNHLNSLVHIYGIHLPNSQSSYPKSGLSAFCTSICYTEKSNMSFPQHPCYMDKDESRNSQCNCCNGNFATKNHSKSLMHMFGIHCPNSQSSYPKVRVEWV